MNRSRRSHGKFSNNDLLKEFIKKSRELIEWWGGVGAGKRFKAGSLVWKLPIEMRVLHLERTKKKEWILKDAGRRIQGLRS